MKTKTILLSVIAFFAVLLSLIFIGQGIQNHAITCEEGIQNAMSSIQVQEKRRYDLIPSLVECVKDYNRHEYETMTAIVEKRGLNAQSAEEIKTLLNAVAEAYPDLKSADNYKNLMNELALTENKIAKMRDEYNQEVTRYNQYTRKFPSSQILDLCGYEKKDYKRLEFANSSQDMPKLGF